MTLYFLALVPFLRYLLGRNTESADEKEFDEIDKYQEVYDRTAIPESEADIYIGILRQEYAGIVTQIPTFKDNSQVAGSLTQLRSLRKRTLAIHYTGKVPNIRDPYGNQLILDVKKTIEDLEASLK
jgi:hypothetical protein